MKALILVSVLASLIAGTSVHAQNLPPTPELQALETILAVGGETNPQAIKDSFEQVAAAYLAQTAGSTSDARRNLTDALDNLGLRTDSNAQAVDGLVANILDAGTDAVKLQRAYAGLLEVLPGRMGAKFEVSCKTLSRAFQVGKIAFVIFCLTARGGPASDPAVIRSAVGFVVGGLGLVAVAQQYNRQGCNEQ